MVNDFDFNVACDNNIIRI